MSSSSAALVFEKLKHIFNVYAYHIAAIITGCEYPPIIPLPSTFQSNPEQSNLTG